MNIAIITGGIGFEHEVSIKSAENIARLVGNFSDIKIFNFPEDWSLFLENKKLYNLVIPVIHGQGGEDGKIQEDLDSFNIPYLFSKPQVHRDCFNKQRTKTLVSDLGISVPLSFSLKKEVTFPMVAKPNSDGSSNNLFLIENKQSLKDIPKNEEWIYEQYLDGREFTVGVIENRQGIQVLPIMEVLKTKPLFEYEDKYSEASDDIEVFPTLSLDLKNKLVEMAKKVHVNLKIRHLSRVDIILGKDQKPYFIEVNTIPGCTDKSFITKMIKEAGINFSQLLHSWCYDVLNNESK